ncbi:MAG: ABC transporter ATP-binding protein [Bacilli bacterium]
MTRQTPHKTKSTSGLASLTHLLPFARPFIGQFTAVFALVVIFNAASVLQPYLVKIAIDRDISVAHLDLHGLILVSLVYIGAVIAAVIANYLQMLLLQYVGQSIIRKIRIQLFSHIESQSMSFFDNNALGRLVTNVSSDTETVSQFFTQFFLSMIRDGLSLLMIIAVMFELNVRIALYCMVVLPIIFGLTLLFRKRLRSAYQTTRTRLSNVVAFLAENLAGMRITQIFHQEGRQAARFRSLNEAHRSANVHEYRVSVQFNRVLDLLGNVAVAGVVWIGGNAVLGHMILFGTLYAFITYIRQFFQPINSLTQQWNTLQSSMVAADRIGRVLAVKPDVVDPVQPLTPREIAGKIEFQNVSFAYKPGETVLDDITFSVAPGTFVGFVGATGAGKSSIMSLLARFYDVSKGRVTVDDIDVRAYRQEDLHRIIGLVQQDVHLFSGTVMDNIRMFRDEFSDQDVMRAADAVGADEIIRRLPQGYETKLFAKGANLSMGERQLVSFARVVLLNPRVLILDEATASLDSQTEAWVQEGLQAVARNRTTLVIAHRLSTVRHAQQIIVLDRGKIVERGDHDTLVARGGMYARLYEKSGIDFQTAALYQQPG